uniref:Uncharacterized protein n=1 Tax=Cyprinus carpio TaxID=7962 RepID=A0A8C1SXP4_CYPCA
EQLHTMIVLCLITLVPNLNDCKGFFYKGIEPSGMDQNAWKICQKLVNRGFYYATLYSVPHKIPLYSAYTLDPKCSRDTGRPSDWHLEPQVTMSQIVYMVCENRFSQNLYKEYQAISSDYSGTGYDRGHLNPNSFQCGDGRTAAFTLTNAAPMIRRFLKPKLDRDDNSATVFIVTGTVPDPNVRIPQDRKRVMVPSHIWTTVCYKHHKDDSKSLSFGYIGKTTTQSLTYGPPIRIHFWILGGPRQIYFNIKNDCENYRF